MPCLQIITAALIACAQAHGPQLRVSPISASFQEAAEHFGFGPLFEHVQTASRRRTSRVRTSRRA